MDAELMRALRELIAKAGEVMRERCNDVLDRIGSEDNCYGGAHTIRALPGVTLEELASTKIPDCCKGGPQWGHDWNCPKLP